MAEELQGLLDRINKEGLEKAEEEKKRLIAEAKKEAEEILQKAKAEAEQIKGDAQTEASKLLASGEAGLKQASRDVIISLDAEIKRILSSIVQASVAEAMNSDRLAEIISMLADAYAKGTSESLEAMASPEQIEELKAAFQAKLSNKFKDGIELKPVVGIEAGVKVSFGGSAVVYDFTSEAVAEMLCTYLNPRILEIVRGK